MVTKLSEIVIKKESAGKILKALDIRDLPPQRATRGDVAYTAYDGARPIGLLMHSMHFDKFYGMTKKQLGHDSEVKLFWISPQYRGAGVGTRLLSQVLADHKKAHLGLATGPRTSDSAKYLYTKYGFKVVNSPVEGKCWWLRKPS